MALPIFIDTSAWIAVADSSESSHSAVTTVYKQLLKSAVRLITSDLVIAESQILLRRRVGANAANVFLDSVNHSPSIEIIFLDQEMELVAKKFLEKFSDQDLSFADAASFAIMKSRKMRTAFTLDHRFAIAGFRVLPEKRQ
jgi:predicted nucleic acid-binding protein